MYIPITQRYLRYSSEALTFYQNYLAMRNTADVTGGKPIAARSQSISGVSAINPLVAFYYSFYVIYRDKIKNYTSFTTRKKRLKD
jgi:hypothetical protein